MPKLELVIDREDDDHVSGVLRGEDGEDVPFVGWIALLSLLQAAVSS